MRRRRLTGRARWDHPHAGWSPLPHGWRHRHSFARQGDTRVVFCRRRWPRRDVVRVWLREPSAGWLAVTHAQLSTYLRRVPGEWEVLR